MTHAQESELSVAPLHTTHCCECWTKSLTSRILPKCTHLHLMFFACCSSALFTCLPAFLGSEIHQKMGKPLTFCLFCFNVNPILKKRSRFPFIPLIQEIVIVRPLFARHLPEFCKYSNDPIQTKSLSLSSGINVLIYRRFY